MAKHRPLEEQVVVITGASSGIGLCTALSAAERGAKLVLVARSEEVLGDVARTIDEQGGEAVAVAADVADRAQLQNAADTAIARFGRIDTWINDAGISIYGLLQDVSEEDSRRLFDVNYWGVVHGSLIALPHLAASGGTLINVGSEASDVVIPYQGMYAASKHAVKGFTDALRIEVEQMLKLPVSVVLIQPAAVNTPYPEHARNYMGEAAKLPPPLIDPSRVAQAMLEAAESGGRDVRVGAMASANIATGRLLPCLFDRLAAMRAKTQQADAPAHERSDALYRPSESGRIHGNPPG
jgi:short-subunit dehydrogenase